MSTPINFQIQVPAADGSLDPLKWQNFPGANADAAVAAYAEQRVLAMTAGEKLALETQPVTETVYVAAPKTARHPNGHPMWFRGFTVVYGDRSEAAAG